MCCRRSTLTRGCCAVLQSTDDPDLRDRAYIYWRLLSTDPEGEHCAKSRYKLFCRMRHAV